MMLKILENKNIKYKYILQIPDNFNSEVVNIAIFFHGSMSVDYENCVNEIYYQLNKGRLKFSKDINESTIFIAPIIPREKEEFLSNGLEVDPQRFTRGCIHDLCEKEYPEYYAPHLEIKKILDDVFDKFKNLNICKKVTLIGVSAGGSFALNFGLLYPHITLNILSFLNTNIFIPEQSLDNFNLPFPFGLANLEECKSIIIDQDKINEYLKIPKFIFTDKSDEKDSLKYDIDNDFYSKYIKIFGENLAQRAENITKLLNSKYKDNIVLLITKNYGHCVPDNIFDEYIEKYLRY